MRLGFSFLSQPADISWIKLFDYIEQSIAVFRLNHKVNVKFLSSYRNRT